MIAVVKAVTIEASAVKIISIVKPNLIPLFLI